MSSQEDYINKLKNKRRLITFFRIFIIVIILFLWELFTRIGIINSFLFSSPSHIIGTFIDLIRGGELTKHILITLYEIFISFIISVSLGFIISIIFLWNDDLYKIFDPYITILNSLPKVALGPLIIIWVGSGIKSIIFMALMISLFITIINIYNGFISVNKKYIIMLKSFGASKFTIFRMVILPCSLLNIISCLKINISMNLIGVIMGEFLVSKSGIGYLIMYASQVFNIDLVITGVVILGIISYVLYSILERIENKFLKNYI